MKNVQTKTAVLLNSSNAFAFALHNTLTSLKKNSPQLAAEADVYIYSWHIPPHEQALFKTIFPNATIAEYDSLVAHSDGVFIRSFTPALFARFEAFKLLKTYERVLCIDVDVLVQQELTPVFDYCPSGMAMALDKLKTPIGTNFLYPVEGFDMNAEPGFNCGIIALTQNLHQNYDEIYDFCLQTSVEQGNNIICGDQSVLMLMIQRFGIKPDVLPDEFNTMAHRSCGALKRARLIHTTGHRKFWCYYYFDEWYNNYQEWIRLGGSPAYRGGKDSRLYRWCATRLGWSKYPFWQTAPDPVRFPKRFVFFIFKRVLRIKY